MSRKIKRISQKIETYFDIVEKISTLSVSSRLKVACIALRLDFSEIASFGYNGNYSNAPINESTGTEEESLEAGKDGFLHAEENMVAKFRRMDPENYVIFLTDSPCDHCTKLLINSGFRQVFWIKTYRVTSHLKHFNRVGVKYGTKKDLIQHADSILENQSSISNLSDLIKGYQSQKIF